MFFKARGAERGQALIVIVFSIIALVGITALAVDGGNALSERRRAQNAADAAALAAALERINNNTSTWTYAAYSSAKQNGFNNDGITNTVHVYSPPISGPNEGDIEYIQVQITAYTKTYFAPVVGVTQITNQVEAVSRTVTPTYAPILGGAAVVSLAPTSDCDNNKAFWIHGEQTLSISGSGIFINSNNADCALIEQGSGSIRIDGSGQIVIVGNASIQKPRLLTPYPPQTGAVSIPYPPPFYMPKVGCGKDAAISADGHSMTSGGWNDIFPPPGVDSLDSGVYCLGAGFTLENNQSLSGNGVVFKIIGGRVQFAGNAHIDLSAPTNGDLAGLLIYQPAENLAPLAINGGDLTSRIQGTILAPGAQIRIKGNNSTQGFHSQIIGYTIDADGTSNVIIKYIDDQNYKALTQPQIQFTK
ncbi:MAG TPA: pilus assembly protein TadG-related protein [Anaerolineales bacterium]|nr:pilus assembly protein TadG-related protein [Anaerolineales bacterium]